MAAALEEVIPEIGKRRTSSEIPVCFPRLQEIDGLSHKELKDKWHELYFEIFSEVNIARKEGDHREALFKCRKAQALIKKVKERGIKDDLLLIREASVHYTIIQSYANFQMEPDAVMREFHNFGEVLFDYTVLILKDDESQNLTIEQIQQQYNENNYVNVLLLFFVLSKYFKENKHKLSTEKLELIWRAAFFFTRFTGAIQDFFLRSTDLINECQTFHDNCKEAAAIASEAMSLLPDGHIPNELEDNIDQNSDTEKYLKRARWTLKDQTQTWLDIYNDFLEIENEHILGNDLPDTAFGPKDTAEIQLRNYKIEKLQTRADTVLQKHEKGEMVLPENIEFALELKAQTTFDDLIRSRKKYQEATECLNQILAKSKEYELKRIETITQIFLARAAIRFNRIDDAVTSAEFIRALRGEHKQKTHVFDKWLDVIDAEIQFMSLGFKQNITNQQKDTNSRTNSVLNNDSCNQESDLQAGEIKKIDEIFSEYRSDSLIKRPKLSYKPLDAKIFYLLGKNAFCKVKLLAYEYKKAKDETNGESFKKGPELLKAFMDCQKYLCEAHICLKDLVYHGSRLFRLIEQKYQQMIDFNDELLNDFKSPNKKTKTKEYDMSEISDDYRIQKWTDMVYQILREKKLGDSADYKVELNNAIGESLKEITPRINRTFIYEEKDDAVRIFGLENTENDNIYDTEFFINSISNYKKGRSRTYFYNKKKGKVFEVMPIDKEEDRYMIMEVDFKLSDNSKELIKEVFKGLRQLLKIKDLMKELDSLNENEPEYNDIRKKVLEHTKHLVEYLFRRHEPTLGHQREMADMCKRIAVYLNQVKDSNIDVMTAEYAGVLHDVGKLYLHPKLLLDMPRRFQDFERKETQKHVSEGVEILRGLLGFKHFKDLILLVSAHHVTYGLHPGYPVEAPGNEIVNLPSLVLGKLENPTTEEKEILSNKLDEDILWMARMMNPADQIQAVRSTDRKYRQRGPMPLSELNGYLNRKAGTDFHPEAVKVIIDMFKKGLIGDNITYSEKEEEDLKHFKEPGNIYSCKDLYEILEQNQKNFESYFGVGLNVLLLELAYGIQCGLLMTKERIGRKLCDLYIEQEGGDVERGKFRYEENKKVFFHILEKNLTDNIVTSD